MAMEVVCGNCQGRLLVEHTGVIVACPHCGAHLQIGDPTPTPATTSSTVPPSLELPPSQPEPQPAVPDFPQFSPQVSPTLVETPQSAPPPPTPIIDFRSPPVAKEPNGEAEKLPEIILTPPAIPQSFESVPAADLGKTDLFTPAANSQTSAGDSDTWMPKIDLAIPPDIATTEPPPAVPESSTLLIPPASSAPAFPTPPPAPRSPNPADFLSQKTDIWSSSKSAESTSETSTIVIPGESHPGGTPFGGVSFDSPTSAPTDHTVMMSKSPLAEAAPENLSDAGSGSSLPGFPATEAPQDAVVPRYLFVLVASYASAITLAFLYLWWRGGAGGSTLDLPDVVPEFKNNKFGLTLIKEDPLPEPYRLKLGETKRYGNIEITPLKVTKGPLEFAYFNNSGVTKPPTQSPVLKLWIKFKNVSDDQTFPPLDEKLLFPRVHDKENVTQERSNNYVCQQSERKRIGKRVPVYSLLINGDWLLKDQKLNTPVGPHKTWETYIPTNDEDLSSLQGPLTWRLHFRKGYNRSSFRGVTTLVEVEFDSKDIQADT